MPLEFQSISHGSVAFGFFNIETDMILLNHYFFFAQDFCHLVSAIAKKPLPELNKALLNIYVIEKPKDIGNLMGAIHGIDYWGFIGETYKRFPFPETREEFKQKPDGYRRRAEMEALIQKYGREGAIFVVIDRKKERVAVGEFIFASASFQELVRYVWMGGYPRWNEETRPDYVLSMKQNLDQSENFLFKGFSL
jgi:hypothetical protein